MSSRTSRPSGPVRERWLAAACALLGLVVVLVAAAEGTPHLRARGAAPAPVAPASPPPAVRRPSPLLPRFHTGPDASSAARPVAIALLVLALVAVLGLLVLVVRAAWRRRPSRVTTSGRGAVGADGVAAAPPGPHVDAPVVRRGIARSLEVLAEEREPADAVVQAWVGLEQTAEDAGVPRAPAETPTEFTARLLTRVPADRAAVEVLRDLYSRARFGARRAEAADARRARAALEALAASWRDHP